LDARRSTKKCRKISGGGNGGRCTGNRKKISWKNKRNRVRPRLNRNRSVLFFGRHREEGGEGGKQKRRVKLDLLMKEESRGKAFGAEKVRIKKGRQGRVLEDCLRPAYLYKGLQVTDIARGNDKGDLKNRIKMVLLGRTSVLRKKVTKESKWGS